MRKILYGLVVLIGTLQIIGYLTKTKVIRDLGVITAASPLPIVFTEVKGVETFASDFHLVWKDGSKEKTVQITPELYSKLKGPYNRRNVFGAAIAYGPVLPEQVWKPILNYGVCEGILEKELGIPIDKESCILLIKTRTANRRDEWTLKTNCE